MNTSQLERNHFYSLTFFDLRGMSIRKNVKYVGTVNTSGDSSVRRIGYKFKLLQDNGDDYVATIIHDEDTGDLRTIEDPDLIELMIKTTFDPQTNEIILSADQISDEEEDKDSFTIRGYVNRMNPKSAAKKTGKGKKSRKTRKSKKSRKSRKSKK